MDFLGLPFRLPCFQPEIYTWKGKTRGSIRTPSRPGLPGPLSPEPWWVTHFPFQILKLLGKLCG